MKRVLIKEIERQKELMNVNEQLSVSNLAKFFGVGKYFDSDTDTTNKPISNLVNVSGSFENIVNTVIDKIEGGYYHPKKHKTSAMGGSGETMMGIDRKHGGSINTSSEGKEFWNTIDKAGASKPDSLGGWKWNYKGGNLEPKLRQLVSKMIKSTYEDFSKRYLSSEAKTIVDSNPALLFHFVYAVWNGPGWFRRFSEKINDQVKRGVKDPSKLLKTALKSRTESGNNIISQSGKKIDNILGLNIV
jgi:hypothetical protein